jgi:hypothetical protein
MELSLVTMLLWGVLPFLGAYLLLTTYHAPRFSCQLQHRNQLCIYLS